MFIQNKVLMLSAVVALLTSCGGGSSGTNSSSSSVSDMASSFYESSSANAATSSETTSSSSVMASSSIPFQSINVRYSEDALVNLENPDRGFYDATYTLGAHHSATYFQDAAYAGYRLIFGSLKLHAYINTPTLPSSLLETIETNLINAEAVGLKIIFRISYRSSNDDTHDPSAAIVKGHLDQLQSVLQSHSRVISVVQAGIIGAYGEWHNFSGDYANTNTHYIQNRREVVEHLAAIFPYHTIELRTPMHKELLFGNSTVYQDEADGAMISQAMALSDNLIARVGHHNDCFLADKTDMGTYPDENIEFWQEYVVNDTQYTPMGGETCKDSSEYTNCNTALAALKRYHYAFLNENYNPDVIARWKDEGCYEAIKNSLGYQLVAKELNVTERDAILNMVLQIENKGFAAPYVPYEVTFILENNDTSYTFEQDIDLRTFAAQETHTIQMQADTTSIAKGSYCLYLKIGAGISTVKLANHALWDEKNQANVLTCNIEI